MSTYAFFSNNLNQKLVFYPVPKNANTSAKFFFIQHCGLEHEFNAPELLNSENNKDKDKVKNKKSVASFLPSKQKFKEVKADLKIVILRDPIKRFVSAYTNRVLYRKDTGFYKHTVDMVIEKLEQNQFDNLHFLPQTYFIGNNLDYFNVICCTKTLYIFEKAVNSFFTNEISFPRVKSHSSDLTLNLSKKQIKKLDKIYESDNIIFETYQNCKKSL